MNSIHPVAVGLSLEEMEVRIRENKRQGLRFVGKFMAVPFGALSIGVLITPSIWQSIGPVALEFSLCFLLLAVIPFFPLRRRP